MALVQRTLPTLFNGVSRQPAILRSFDQTDDELNTWAELSSGVGKRPPTQHVAKLMEGLPGGAFLHAINRDSTERYFVVIASGVLRVFDFDGNEKTVNAPGGLTYLSGSSYAAVTVADYTFIVNRNTTVRMKDVGADETAPPPYLRYPTRQPPKWNREPMLDADNVLPGSELQYPANPPVTGGLTGTVGSMEELPTPPAGLYKVSGNAGQGFTNYYVRAEGSAWEETVAPGLKNAVDETTMPHCLIREGDGTFTFAPFSWAPRRVGDDATNPAPTFVGRKLRDVAFYQNRLVFLVDESVVMSCAGDFGNFWRSTVLDLIASDVIDVAVTTANVAILDFITLFNDGALLFADQTQFSLSNAEDGVTPASIAIRPITRYPLNRRARPVVVGTEVYFAGDTAGYSVLYEYTRQSDGDSTSAAEITAHVPGLVPTGITHLVPLPRGILALTGTENVYCYQLYWNGNEKVMSAWRPWKLSGKALAAEAVDSRLFMVVQEADGVYLEILELADGATPASQNWNVWLDRRFEIAGTEAGGFTTFTLPYPVPAAARQDFLLIGGKDGSEPYGTLEVEWISDTQVRVPKGSLGTCCGGFVFDTMIRFSEQFQVTPQGVPVTSGRLLLRQFRVNLHNTSTFDAIVWPYGKASHPDLEARFPSKTQTYVGRTFGSGSAVLGQPPVEESDSFAFSITGSAESAVIELHSRSHAGATFTSAEWEGFYNNRR